MYILREAFILFDSPWWTEKLVLRHVHCCVLVELLAIFCEKGSTFANIRKSRLPLKTQWQIAFQQLVCLICLCTASKNIIPSATWSISGWTSTGPPSHENSSAKAADFSISFRCEAFRPGAHVYWSQACDIWPRDALGDPAVHGATAGKFMAQNTRTITHQTPKPVNQW